MIQPIPLHLHFEAEALWYLQQSSFRIEAAIIGFQHIPPIRDTIASLQKSSEVFLGYYDEEQLLGAISYKREDHQVIICRLMVHPDHFRKGIASALLAYVLENVRGEEYIVSAGVKNTPAVRLYEKFGFEAYRQMTPIPGVPLTMYRKLGESNDEGGDECG